MALSANVIMSLFKSMGLTENDIANMKAIVGRASVIMLEIDAFKQGSGQAMQHFNARLDRLEMLLTTLIELQRAQSLPCPPHETNGANITYLQG